MAISIATMGKFEYIKGTDRAAYRLGIGGTTGRGDVPKKPQVVIGQVVIEDNKEFEIYDIEEEIIWLY